jgi:D-psicose/D-tagatose/L-ribulose 3-epimerase
MRLAIQEDMLAGKTTLARFELARELGLDGVEVWADHLDERIYELAEAIMATGIGVSGVNLSRSAGYLSPLLPERESAISRMRQALADALDLQTTHVIFTPHNQTTSPMPDLTPYRSARELESEMMVWLLRTVSDLAYALGATLHMQPAHRYRTNFMNTLAQAGHFCEAIKDHEHIRIAPHTLYMAHEERDLYEALHAQIARVGYVHVGDSNHGLPTQGTLDWDRIARILRDDEYEGWVVISAGDIGANHDNAYDYTPLLPDVLKKMHEAGF